MHSEDIADARQNILVLALRAGRFLEMEVVAPALRKIDELER